MKTFVVVLAAVWIAFVSFALAQAEAAEVSASIVSPTNGSTVKAVSSGSISCYPIVVAISSGVSYVEIHVIEDGVDRIRVGEEVSGPQATLDVCSTKNGGPWYKGQKQIYAVASDFNVIPSTSATSTIVTINVQ